jgi:hypothetical protein
MSVGGGGGSSGESGSSAFSRAGTSSQKASYSLPSSLLSLIDDSKSIYGDDHAKKNLYTYTDRDGSTPGFSSLVNTSNLNPYTSTYENATQAQYDNLLQKSMSVARTGMENVLAPLNRGKEYREQEAINQGTRERHDNIHRHQLMDNSVQMEASKLLSGNELQADDSLNRLKTANAQGLLSFADLLGTKSNDVLENFSGQGSQSGTGYSYGGGASLGCCFIFLEAYNGKLPEHVRQCRDEFYTPKMRSGYTRMSLWLVPLMKHSKIARYLTNKFMIQPLTAWGGWYKNVKGYEKGHKYLAYKNFWFWFWTKTGNESGEVKYA